MSDGDRLRRFVFEQWPVRGHYVRLEASWRAVIEHHDYPPAVRDTLGEALAASVLLAGTLKFDGQLTLQLQGPGPLHLLVTQCTSGLAIRGVARHRGAVETRVLEEMTGGGQLAVTLETDDREHRYQGVVPLIGTGLSASLEHYFQHSEQLASRLLLACTEHQAAGLLLQRLPVGSTAHAEDDPQLVAAAEDEWQRLQLLAGTLTPAELLGESCETVLHRLFHEDDVRLFEGAPVFFQCACSRERVTGIIRSLGAAEAQGILQERGDVEVRCEFCNRAWSFDAVDIARLFSPGVTHAPPPGLH
jgi:molecular chaperone Hsp33